MNKSCDVLIVGTGVAGVYTALNLDSKLNVMLITKEGLTDCNSYLAQGGISVALDSDDYDNYIENTLAAGNYKNNREAVEILVKESRDNIKRLENLHVEFDKNEDNTLAYTREGGHDKFRILHIKDETGKFVMQSLYKELETRKNITVIENCSLIDIINKDSKCLGGICTYNNEIFEIHSKYTVLATGGLGGLFTSSTNVPTLTGDGIAIALKNNIELKDIDYLQLHPTVLYEKDSNCKRLLLSESLRGEGAIIKNQNGEEFVDSLKPRDVVSNAILNEIKKTPDKPYVYLDLTHLDKDFLIKRFPFLYNECLKRGYAMEKDMLPISPAHHYAMGGIKVNMNSETSLKNLYAVGETACTGVHGSNRLASNSLLEGLVFGYRCAEEINSYLSVNSNYSPIDTHKLMNFFKERVNDNYVRLLND
ncbi:MAG: L-aspartate oxidase [Clostridium sp.]|nr:L-aspartate oxidase [Clostridium sp.]MDY3828687.1 L-aspartate oxidase [Clostridium sp.]